MPNSDELDEAIRAVYRRHDEAVDEILVRPQQAEQFAAAVRDHSDRLASVDTSTVLRRLCTLRKRGEQAGGLPRRPR